MIPEFNIILIVYLAFVAYHDWKHGKVHLFHLWFGLLIGLASFAINPQPYSLIFILILLGFGAIQRKLKLDYVGEADIFVLSSIMLILPTMQGVTIIIGSLVISVILNVIGIKMLRHQEVSTGIKGLPVILMVTLLSYLL